MTPASSRPVRPATADPKTVLYQEVCNSYRAIDDLRMRVLGFLPLVSGVGIFFLLNNSVIGTSSREQPTSFAQFLLPIGLIGAIVTLGLFFYDIRAIQLRTSLVKTGKKIEHSLGIGQFTTRPQHRFGIIGDTGGSTLIYTVVIAGWVFSALISISPLAAWIAAVILFLIGVTAVGFSGGVEILQYYYGAKKYGVNGEQQKGEAAIHAGDMSTQIAPTAVQTDPDISVMPNISSRISTMNWVHLSVDQVLADSFTVKLDKALGKDIKFKWWIRN